MSIPTHIPDGFEAYGRSPEFTPETLPAKLQSAHSTKAGVWALLHIIEGEVLYQLEPPRQGELRARWREDRHRGRRSPSCRLHRTRTVLRRVLPQAGQWRRLKDRIDYSASFFHDPKCRHERDDNKQKQLCRFNADIDIVKMRRRRRLPGNDQPNALIERRKQPGSLDHDKQGGERTRDKRYSAPRPKG